MEERFKFRFFDNVSKEMCYPTEYNGKAEYLERRYDLADMFRFKDLIPMQSTGLRDKTGKWIYEGDIVKIDGYGVTGVYEMIWCDATAKFVVNIYEEDCFEHSQSVMEIIGNIYENKELLEEQK